MDNSKFLAENKVLILYTLDNLNNGLFEDSLYKILSSVSNINYFLFKDILTDLLNSNLVNLTSKAENTTEIYQLTSDGKTSLDLTINILPGLLKLKIDHLLKEKLSTINNESSSAFAEFSPKNDHDYMITCKLVDNNETIFELKTFSSSRRKIKKNCRKLE